MKPLDPSIENIEDILVTDDSSASELLERHPDVLIEISIDIENFKGFPRVVNQLGDIDHNSKVLIMRNGGIGDHVMLLPALQVYREMFPKDTEIWFATQKEKHPIFYDNQNINRLIPLPVRLNEFLGADVVIDFSGRADWYDLRHLHMTDSYLNFLKIDYMKETDKVPVINWNRDRSPMISALFDNVRMANSQKPLVLLNWKASNRLRDLPPEKLLFLVDSFKDVIFVIAQTRKDIHEVESILKGNEQGIFNCTPHMNSLEQYMAAIANCDGVVSTDTAAGHLAEAMGKPSLILYGPTLDDLWIRYYKKTRPLRAEYTGKACKSPCGLTKNTTKGCPEAVCLGRRYSPCLTSISDERISAEFEALLAVLR